MNNPFNFFNKIYCINLKERTDRWEQCLKNFEKLEITNYERIDAIKVNGDLNSKRKGQIGCAMSFVKCFNDAILKKYENILILEDDFLFIDEKEILFSKTLASINDLPNDWDSLYFGGTVVNDYNHIPIQKYSSNLFKLNSAHCLHSVAFSKNGLLKIKDFFNKKDDWYLDLINKYEAIDIFFAKDYQHQTNSFISKELLCYQKINPSNIENCISDYSQWMNRNFNYFKSII